MECQRLQKLVKNWYLQVQDEAMAPARMVGFMEKHLLDCDICRADARVAAEVEQIISIILPPAKARPAATAGENEDELVPDQEEGDTDAEEQDDGEETEDDDEEVLDDED